MPELLSLEAEDWSLTVWCHDIVKAQSLLRKTLSSRNKSLPNTCLRFNPSLYLVDDDCKFAEYDIDSPIFFENKQYEFDFQFQTNRNIRDAKIKHRLTLVEEAFHSTRNSLRGSINFANHIGWFKLELCYQNSLNKTVSQKISFEVLPTKMDLAEDINAIHQVIDQQYPLLRFSFAQKTEQELELSRKPHERFQLLWLSHFQRLREELEKATRHILHNPHSRLLSYNRKYRVEQLRGRLSPRLQEIVYQDLVSADLQKRYTVNSKTLSLNTPENRFIKMVLMRCSRELSLFLQRARENNSVPEHAVLSESFFDELEAWKKPFDRYLQQPFFREIGLYEGLTKESLVLHQKPGYANVYRIWQQLKLYLDVFGRQASISMKSIAELYEIWCVLEVRRLLIEELGFVEKKSHKASMSHNGFEKRLERDEGAAFHLERGGICIRLVHERLFSKSDDLKIGNIYSWTTSQKPDIFLEATFSNGEKIRWIFDAKYRISPSDDVVDFPPDDAINQMHRYRDALIYIHGKTNRWKQKQRPIFGAFVLYPGVFNNENSKNPYAEAIKEVGIGAFPLLPNANNVWLKDFLLEQLGDLQSYPEKNVDSFYVQEAPRISYTGLELTRFRDLTLVAALGGKRDKNYKEGFRNGTAKWYHTPNSTVVSHSEQTNIMHEVRYCAFAVQQNIGGKGRSVEYVYPVMSVCLEKRENISRDQAGAEAKASNLNKEYWLIELGKGRKIKSNVIKVGGHRNFKFQLTGLGDLEKAKEWGDLSDYYSFLASD